MASPDPSPSAGSVLVTGVPRSGTTWLARELARSRGAGLAGREPMNPRGGQFALDGTLTGWAELDQLSPHQETVLRRCYAGREPRVLSRYGERQLRAVLPWTTTVVKDPFALLSLPVVVRVTGAVPVVLYRSAVSVLASYRRMGWRADTAEVRALSGGPTGLEPVDDVEAMGEFWNELHRRVLARLSEVPGAVVVSHGELLAAGPEGIDLVARRCGLGPRRAPSRSSRRSATRRGGTSTQLHDFDRTPEQVSQGWRSRVDADEAARLQDMTNEVAARLDAVRVPVGAHADAGAGEGRP